MVSTVPSRVHVQSPVVPLVAADAVSVKIPIGTTDTIRTSAKTIDKSFFIL